MLLGKAQLQHWRFRLVESLRWRIGAVGPPGWRAGLVLKAS
jgi:hypothetical protein